jgi:hypothetical protein
MTISWRHQLTRGGGIYKAGITLKQWEVEVARKEDKRMSQCVVKTTGGNGCSTTRRDTTTSQGKLEWWIGGGLPGWQLAPDKRQRSRVTFTKWWNVYLTKFAHLDFFYKICYVFYVFGCNLGQNKRNVFYIKYIKYHISLCFYVFGNAPLFYFRCFNVLACQILELNKRAPWAPIRCAATPLTK